MSKAIVRKHAGDDSDGRIWGIEGMNSIFQIADIAHPSLVEWKRHFFTLGGTRCALVRP
jgi:hypothetical protein